MSLQQPPQTPISIGLAPQQSQGARMVGPLNLTFTGLSNGNGLTNVITDDLIMEGEDGSINNIQSVYFDSSDCPLPVYFTIGDTQQTILFPAKSQGYLPVLATNSMRYTALGFGGGMAAGATATLELSFFNTPVAPFIWSTMPSQMLVVSTANAGNTVISLTPNNFGTAPIPVYGRDLWIHGFDITGGGATVEAAITATLGPTASLNFGGGTQNISFVIDVPAIGGSVNFTRKFDPPLRSVRAAAGTPNDPVLTVPAFGAGNLASGAVIYYSIG